MHRLACTFASFSLAVCASSAHAQTVPVSPATELGKQGAVLLQREGHVLGLGAVLGGDGRILTSLSGLLGKETADVRYSDGTTGTSKIGYKDPTTDLALLLPFGKKHLDGFRASELDPKRQRLDVFVHRTRPEPTGLSLFGDADVRKPTGERLPAVFDIAIVPASPPGGWVDPKAPPPPPPPALLPGAPIVDASGDLIGVVVKLCRTDGANHCTPTAVAAGVPLLRQFLGAVPASATIPPSWIGLAGESDLVGGTRGVRIIAVAPGGPAQKAGLKFISERKKSQIILSVEGVPVDTPERLAKELSVRGAGEVVHLSVREGDRIREVAVTLGVPPETMR